MLVVIESPYSGNVKANVEYARQCVRDSLLRGEAPIASHLLYTPSGILDDEKPDERKMGMRAGWEWMRVADLVAVYTDMGISQGMLAGMSHAAALGKHVVLRRLYITKD